MKKEWLMDALKPPRGLRSAAARQNPLGISTVKDVVFINIRSLTPQPAKHCRQAEPTGHALAYAVQRFRQCILAAPEIRMPRPDVSGPRIFKTYANLSVRKLSVDGRCLEKSFRNLKK
jgi:hypothetical protein